MSDAATVAVPSAEVSEKPRVLIRQPHGGALLPPVGHPDRPKGAPTFSDPSIRNAAGRPKLGGSVEEWLDALAQSERAELERLVADPRTPSAKCIAAVQVLTARESGDLADYEPYLDGRLTLAQLKKSGVGMYRVKSAKVRRTVDANGQPVETREIELHASAGPAFDRVMDRTIGKAIERKQVSVDISHLTPVPLIHLPAGYSPAPLPSRAAPALESLSTEALQAELRRRGAVLPVESVSRPAPVALPDRTNAPNEREAQAEHTPAVSSHPPAAGKPKPRRHRRSVASLIESQRPNP